MRQAGTCPSLFSNHQPPHLPSSPCHPPPTHLTPRIRPAMPQNDTKKLAEAKALVYLKGFTDGVLVVGEHAGKKVRAGRGREGRWWWGGGGSLPGGAMAAAAAVSALGVCVCVMLVMWRPGG